MNDKPKLGDRLAGGFARGLAIGWIVGAVWWVCLAIYFGPSGETFIHDGITEEKHISVLQRCIYAPIAGAPWAVVGGGVGAVIGGMGGWLEIVTCVLGMLAAFCFQLSHDLIDGWLAITMPISAFVGTALGLVVGVVARLVARTVCFLFTRR